MSTTEIANRPQVMSIVGALALAAALGAVQIAAGQAATGPTLADRFHAFGESGDAQGINRAAKSDRDVAPAPGEARHRTVVLRLEGVDATSVLVRIPGEKQARKFAPPPAEKPAGVKKMTVACEPPVSLLTEVAKLLQPGRCVT